MNIELLNVCKKLSEKQMIFTPISSAEGFGNYVKYVKWIILHFPKI